MIRALKRLYLMAHAPAEPQMWFEPTTPSPAPVGPAYLSNLTPEERRELDGWRDCIDTCDLIEPRVRAYAEAADAHRKDMREWVAARDKATLIQWPRAWAEAVIGAAQ